MLISHSRSRPQKSKSHYHSPLLWGLWTCLVLTQVSDLVCKRWGGWVGRWAAATVRAIKKFNYCWVTVESHASPGLDCDSQITLPNSQYICNVCDIWYDILWWFRIGLVFLQPQTLDPICKWHFITSKSQLCNRGATAIVGSHASSDLVSGSASLDCPPTAQKPKYFSNCPKQIFML